MTQRFHVGLLATAAALALATSAAAQTDPGQRAPCRPGDAPATSPTAPGQTGIDISTTDVARPATGDKATDNANGPPGALGDIVVTANRVESLTQKTPIALTVYSGADLAAAGVTSIANLQRIDPSVNFTAQPAINTCQHRPQRTYGVRLNFN